MRLIQLLKEFGSFRISKYKPMPLPRIAFLVSHHSVVRAALCAMLIGAAAAAEKSPPAIEVLFNGKNLRGWRSPTDEWIVAQSVIPAAGDSKKFEITRGEGVLINGVKGRAVNLISESEHGDVEAHVEFMVPKDSNSGVYFQGRYEIQILDSWGVEHPKYSDCGGIYQRWINEKGFEGHAPRVNASRRPGEWQTFDVLFRAPRFDAAGKKIANARFVKVTHNGHVIHENVEVTGSTRAAVFESDEKPTGPIMLQGDHGPVAFRNITIKRVTLP